MKQTDYIDLLLDALALIFIVEVAEILYAQVLRPEVRSQTESLEPMQVPMYGIDYLNKRPALVDVIQLTAIVLVTLCWMTYYYWNTLIPLFRALECTCIGEGEYCRETQRFSYDFWYKYWKEDVPAVFAELDKLKAGSPGATAAAPAAAPAASSGNETAAAAPAAATALYLVPKVIEHAKHMFHRHSHPENHHQHHEIHHHRKHVEVFTEKAL